MRDVDYKEDYLGDRKEGIGLDAKKLEETFKAFGYDILSFKNLRAAQIQKFLSTTQLESFIKKDDNKKSLENYASLVVCLLGHGDKGVFVGVDDIHVSLNEIQYDAFNDVNCPHLIGKPKIFIVLACQGSRKQMVIERPDGSSAVGPPLLDEEPSSSLPLPMNKAPDSVEERLPPVYDFIRLVSTIEEYQSQFSINIT